MAKLFQKDEKIIRKHINNIFNDEELERESNTQKMSVAGVDQLVAFYNLDVIISVGYRVKSKNGIMFRKWANKILKEYLIKGYAVNNKRLEYLKKTINLIDIASRVDDNLKGNEAREIINVLKKFTLNKRIDSWVAGSTFGLGISAFLLGVISSIINLYASSFLLPIAIASFVIGPIIGGLTADRIVLNYYKKKLNQFSSSKTKEEILDYTIEIAKIQSKNDALEIAHDYVSGKCKIQKYLVESSNELTYEEEESRNYELATKVNEVEKEIDVIVQKQVLNKEFYHIRNKTEKKFMRGIEVFLGIMCGSVIGTFSSAIAGVYGVALGVLGGIGVVALNKKSNNRKMKLFNKFNSQLGDDKLPLYEDEKELSAGSLYDKIAELSYLYAEVGQSDVRLLNMERIEREKEDNIQSKEIVSEFTRNDEISISNEVNGPRLVKRQ